VLLVDTGPLVAASDTDDAHHQACRVLLEDDPGPLVTSPMVIAEAAYLLDRQLGPAAEAALFASITDGSLRVENLGHVDWERIGELVATYADLRLGGTDASLVALAERLGVATIATLNRRDFTVVRPRHVDAFELLP
jgi:predicted nucleic acid-binding protein